MLTSETHEAHISRHVQLLRRKQAQEKVDRLLARCELREVGAAVTRLDGSLPSTIDCTVYLRTVAELFGDATAAFTRANFVLAGCSSASSL